MKYLLEYNKFVANKQLRRAEAKQDAAGIIAGDASNLFVNIESDITLSDDFSLATLVSTTYDKRIFKNSTGTNRLSYFDGSDVLTVVDVNT